MKGKRHSIRLKGYDYSQEGYYFVTICTHERECLFGEIVGATGGSPKMILNKFGEITQNEWINSSKIRNEIELDEFVIMPNHVHGIVIINCDQNVNKGDQDVNKDDQPIAPTLTPKSIGAMMAGFKSVVTKQINTLRKAPGAPVWQRNYYEHIIRDENDLNRIQEYIKNNSLKWELDEYYV